MTRQGPIHLVGIGGMHMSAIARLLMEQGVSVSGSDTEPTPLIAELEHLGATVFEGHARGQIGEATLVVTTAAAKDDNPELVEARERGIPVMLRAEMVAELMEPKRVIAVAGAHGKTTTSSLVAFILERAGLKPMYLLGGESIDLGGNAAWGEGDLCVVEADEYKRAFHEYSPATSIITNVEADHLDYYGTEEAYFEAFVEFGGKTKPGGLLLMCGDDPGALRVAGVIADRGTEPVLYGLGAGLTWRATNLTSDGNGLTFVVEHDGESLGTLRIQQPGEHMVRNALAAAVVCLAEGVPFEAVAGAVAAFKGARRRFETIGEAGGVLVMDDYAHHPTEVRATLTMARKRFPERRIIAVHQPHTYSRIAYLWDEWTSCWAGADRLVILETYAAREQPVEGRSAQDLTSAISSPEVSYAADFDDAAAQAAAVAKPGDVVITIGAGDVFHVGPKLLEALR